MITSFNEFLLVGLVSLTLCSFFCSFWSVLVRQLIKSQRVQNKLGIVFEKEKDKSQRKDFIFASAKVHANTIIQNPTLMFLLKLRKHHIVCVCLFVCVRA